MSALVSAVLLWLAGHAVLGLARALGARRSLGPLELNATAWLLGAACVPVAAFYLVAWFGPLPRSAGLFVVLLPAVPGLACALGAHRRGWRAWRAWRARAGRPKAVELAAILAILYFAGFAVFAASSVPRHGFDATFHYAYKGQLLYHEGFATAAWTDLGGLLGRTMTHPSYPPLLPGLELVVAWVGGGWSDDAARPLSALFALAPAALIAAALRRDARAGRGAALLGALAWLATPLLYYWRLPRPELAAGLAELASGPGPGGIRAPAWNLDGTADLPLAAFFLGAFLHFARLARGRPDRLDVLGAGVCTAGALLVKNEGSALVVVLLASFGLRGLFARLRGPVAPRPPLRLSAWLGAWGLVALASAPWFLVRAVLPKVDENYPERLTPAFLAESIGRTTEVAARFARTLGDVSMWNLTWPLLAASAAWALARRRSERALGDAWLALAVVCGAALAYAGVLLVTPWDLGLLETTGIPMRLLFHVAPLAHFATFALLFAGAASRQADTAVTAARPPR